MTSVLDQIPERFRNLRFDGYDVLPGKVADDGTLVTSADDFVWLYRVACLRISQPKDAYVTKMPSEPGKTTNSKLNDAQPT